jgi:hypothetical protein
MSEPTDKTLAAVRMRDHDKCAHCGATIASLDTKGARGVLWSLHHRCPRSMGGTKREWVNLPGNLVLLHGSGTTGCHGKVESKRLWATDAGFLVSANGTEVSAEVAIVHAVHGICFLDDLGNADKIKRGQGYAF